LVVVSSLSKLRIPLKTLSFKESHHIFGLIGRIEPLFRFFLCWYFDGLAIDNNLDLFIASFKDLYIGAILITGL
jgi:hypothetical protein